MTRVFICLLLLLGPYKGLVQNLPKDLIFEHYTVADGLPGRNIRNATQDPMGFLWVATSDNGIARFDGLGFKPFRKIAADSNSLFSNDLYFITPMANVPASDPSLWIYSEDAGIGQLDPSTETFELLDIIERKTGIKANSLAWYESVDSQGRSWIGTKDFGLFLVYPNDSIVHYFHDKTDVKTIGGNSPLEVIEIDRNNFYIADYGGGLSHLNLKNGDITRYTHDPEDPQSLLRNGIMAAFKTSSGKIWLSINGISIFDPTTKTFTNLTDKDLAPERDGFGVMGMCEDPDNLIWVGTNAGLFVFDQYTLEFQRFVHDPDDPYSLASNFIWRTYVDQSGHLWLGTASGLDKVDRLANQFGFINIQSLAGAEYVRFMQEAKGRVWLRVSGTAGWKEYLKDSNQFNQVQAQYNGNKIRIRNLRVGRGGKIWASSPLGIGQYNPSNQTLSFPIKFPQNVSSRLDLHEIFEDKRGDIWFSSKTGLHRWDAVSSSWHLFLYGKSAQEALFMAAVGSMLEAPDGFLWMSESSAPHFRQPGSTINSLDPETQEFTPIWHVGDSISLNNSYLLDIDDRGRLWISTADYLILAEPRRDQLHNAKTWKWSEIGLEQGPAHSLHQVAADEFWLVSRERLMRFRPGRNEHDVFSLPIQHETIFCSSYSEEQNLIFLGGAFGVYHFNPKTIRLNNSAPRVRLTDFKLFNRSVPVRGTFGDTLAWESPLSKTIAYTSQLTLAHWQNDFSIDFAALDFAQPEKNQYKYQLVNYEKDWINTTAMRPGATYTNIPPGRYTFRVVACNNDGFWNLEGAKLDIHILPAWYWAPWSKALYLILGLLLLYIIYQFQINRRLAIAEAKRLQELDAAKTQLYTNITHEFRTPLTIIMGMADQLRDQVGEHGKEGMRMIKRNSRLLLNLVNQMLDLAKLESQKITLEYEQGDIVIYLKYLIESFHSYAESKGIRLHFLCKLEEFYMDYDGGRLQHIMSNLLSNALKFSPEGKDVYVMVEELDETLQIVVKDTGIGIPEEKLPFIFDSFYQVDATINRKEGGTGIGLTLTKELVKLMNGKLSVESTLGKGSEFKVLLPVTRQHPVKSREQQKDSTFLTTFKSPEPTVMVPKTKNEKPLLLIVEDNTDLVKFLLGLLHPIYKIEIAYSGLQGIEKATTLIPDLIITDVMMPEKDGFELCADLKEHQLTSHIPIIMLTAKVDVASRLRGLSRGADAYLEKPFLQEELKTRLQVLLKQRQRLQAYYLSKAGLSEEIQSVQPSPEEAKQESSFLAEVNQIVEKYLDDKDFTVEQLGQELFVDPSNLYRKIKALTGLGPSQYIRSFRLAKAKDLLLHTDLPIISIAAECGFSDQNYFSRIFKKEMGITPTEYRAQK